MFHTRRNQAMNPLPSALRLRPPGLARRRLTRLIQLAVGTSAGGLMLGAHAQIAPPSVGGPPPGAMYGYYVTGAPGATGVPSVNGGVGGTGGNAGLAGGTFGYTGTLALTAFGAVSVGGVGGSGAGGSDSSGGGGDGGTGGSADGQFVGGAVTGTSSAPTMLVTSTGGDGGTPGVLSQELGTPGKPGNGGAGGAVSFEDYVASGTKIVASQDWVGGTAGATAVLLQSTGGKGGDPSSGAQSIGSVDGAPGGNGGNGGSITATIGSGAIQSKGAALVAISQGGAGNTGTAGTGGLGKGAGGNGGNGGNGGDVTLNIQDGATLGAVGAPTAATGAQIPIDQSGNVAEASSIVAGLLAQSLGGVGGDGGSASGAAAHAGTGGAAGTAGTVTLNPANGTMQISTTGFSAPGVVLQAIGGPGGNGAYAGGAFSSHQGNGADGGNGGTVNATLIDKTGGAGFIATAGNDSAGLIAQSIGGGGGVGGSVQAGSALAGVAIGGNGEAGGDGGVVTLYNGQAQTGELGYVIKTKGGNSSALVAQSIGGGGGAGGSAGSTAIGVFDYVVGGSGGGGGEAGVPGSTGATWVTVENNGIVSTSGNHSKGVVAQAVGGGGGEGGSAASLTGAAQFDINVSVGGQGGSGGNGGNVKGTNSQQILSSGSDAWGLLVQSVGGGGGNGGSSKDDSWVLAPPGPVPTLSLVVDVGGKGQKGGNSGDVTGTNNGLIMTSGATAHGLMVQSIGGGGGNGGDSSALNEALGSGTALDVTVNVGGTGGSGGTGGNVTATNGQGELIWTLGDSARGIFAQSVSDGGGSGGTAKTDGDFLKKAGADGQTFNITLGGDGGGGGDSTTVTVNNGGAIMTLGDTADAIFAQSIGGGGGLGGHASTQGASGHSTANLTVGGSSGTPSNGGTVTVTNTGIIMTRGGNSAGIFAQSVGGGGGKAGTPTKGGDTPATMSVQDFLADSSMAAYITTYADGTLGWKDGAWNDLGMADLQKLAADYHSANAKTPPPAGTEPDTQGATTNLNLGSGDKLPGGHVPDGAGGAVTVTNSGQIQTNGPLAAGIWAQSIGGGGGDVGATNVAATTSGALTTHDTQVNVGGQGFNVGNGGTVTVNHSGQISTMGDAGYGILAQSIAGGGGHATTTDSVTAATTGTLNVSIGGGGNVHGDGAAVNVQSVNGGAASIATAGNDAIGILAQSIGAGGGVMAVMHTKASADGNTTGTTDPGASGATTNLTIGNPYVGPIGPNDPPSALPTCNGQLVSSCGNGSTVTVAADVVSTQGRDAHGILAQSIGGSGGTLLGANPTHTNPFVNRSTTLGNGGAVAVTVNDAITTTGAGAYGVLAQSIGGGGLLAGDLSMATAPQPFPAWTGNEDPTTEFLQGNGGAVTVTLQPNAVVHTTQGNAHAIFAQSVGGGGGFVNTTGGTYMGSMGGAGTAGPINIDIGTNALVQADGQGASAIHTNSEGQKGGNSFVLVTNAGTIQGNASAPAILFTGNGNANGNGTLINNGSVQNPGGVAVAVAGNDDKNQPSFVVVTNNAMLMGDLQLTSGGTLDNKAQWMPGVSSTVGQVTNESNATIDLGTTLQAAPTSTLAGDLVSSGAIRTNVDFYAKTSSSLDVQGTAALKGGRFMVALPANAGLAPNPVTVLIGESGLSLDPSVTAVNANNTSVSYAISTPVFNPVTGGALVQLTPSTQFAMAGAAKGYSSSQASLGAHLDAGFTKDMSPAMSRMYGRLASMDDAHLQGAMDSLGNEAVQSVGVARLAASQDFVERMNSCPRFGPDGLQQGEQDCVWSRAMGDEARHDGSATTIGYKSDVSKVQIGGQRAVGNDWFVGGSFGYDQGTLSALSTSVSGGGWTAAVVAKKKLGDWLISGAMDAGTGHYDSQRQLALGDFAQTAAASFSENHIGLHARIARQIGMDGWYLKPYVDLHAIHLHTGAYAETGADGLNLQVNAADGTAYTVSPTLEAGRLFELDHGVQLHAYVSLGAVISSQNAWSATARLQGSVPAAGTFTTTSELPGRRTRVNAGFDLVASKNLDVRLEYSGEFASGFRSNGAMLKAAYSF
jgi:hypothetical protein